MSTINSTQNTAQIQKKQRIDYLLTAVRSRADVFFIIGATERAIKGYDQAIVLCQQWNACDMNMIVGLQLDLINVLMRTHHDYDQILKRLGAIMDQVDKKRHKAAYANLIRLRGSVYWYKGNYAVTLSCYQEAQKIYKEIGDRKNFVDIYGNIGLALQYQGKYRESLRFYNKYIDALMKQGNLPKVAGAYGNIGTVYSFMGETEKAVKYYLRDLELAESIGYKYEMGTVLSNMGISYAQKGDLPKALDFFQRSLAIARQMDDQRSIGINENNIGLVYYNMGDLNAAYKSFQAKLAISKKLSDKQGICIAYSNLGIIQQYKGNYTKALQFIQKTLTFAQSIKSQVLIGSAQSYLGSIYTDIGRYQKAKNRLSQAERLFSKYKARFELSLNNVYTAELYYKQKKYTQALHLTKKALAYSQKTGYKKHEVGVLYIQGKIYTRLKDLTTAENCLQQSIALAREHQHVLELAKSLYELARIQKLRKNRAGVTRYGKEARKIFVKAGADIWIKRLAKLM